MGKDISFIYPFTTEITSAIKKLYLKSLPEELIDANQKLDETKEITSHSTFSDIDNERPSKIPRKN